MAFLIPKKLGQGAIVVSPGLLVYTAPTLITTIIKCIDICNTTAGALTVSVHLVPLAGTASTANALFYTISIPANSTYQWFGTQIMNAGGFIQAIGSGAGLTVNVGGGEYSS